MNQTTKYKKMARCRRMAKVKAIWSNSLTVFGLLGLGVVFLSQYIPKVEVVLVFGQIMSIVAYAVLIIILYWLLQNNCAHKITTMIVFIGVLGIFYGLLVQLYKEQVMDKPPVFHLANTIYATALTMLFLKINRFIKPPNKIKP